jgi:hypothetical protein
MTAILVSGRIGVSFLGSVSSTVPSGLTVR